jgi:Xaa-Pro aminopeptidase
METMIAGKSEAEAAAAAAFEVIRAGGNYHAIPCCHGRYSENFVTDPLNGYSVEVPNQGDIVRGWIFGPIFQGYWLDPGRTAVCGGAPSPEQRRLIEDCAGIVDGVMQAVRPGVRVKDVAAVGDRLKEAAGGASGQGGEMWPYYGHGNGGMWEPPLIHADLCDDDEIFEEGMVASSETFLYREGVGGAGFEQNYIVRKDGVEVITNAPMIWW